MRIVYTCQNTTVRGGLERMIVEKANAMAAAGNDVALIVNNPPGAAHAYSVSPAVRVCDIGMPAPRGLLSRLRFKLVQDMRMWRLLRHLRPDITVAVPTWLTQPVLSGPGRLVLESHSSRGHMFDGEKRSRYKRLKVALAERLAACVVTLTRADADSWRHARRIAVIPNFSDMSAPEADLPRRHAMAMGRLSAEKQYDLLIDAWRIVADTHPDARLDIYGDGPMREELLTRIHELGLTQNVRLCGRSDCPAAEYARHSFLVLSSNHEGQPMALIEAMRCGCPCVATDCPEGPREIIANGTDGLLVPYRDRQRDERVRLLASAICHMIENPAMCAEMGRRAAGNSARFDKATITAQWEQLFTELLR